MVSEEMIVDGVGDFSHKIDKMVCHPKHYQSNNGLEVWDVIDAFTDVKAFDEGNIIKYICRWKQKNGLQDLYKAKEYLEHLINYVEKENK